MYRLSLLSKILVISLAFIYIIPATSCSTAKDFSQYERFCIVQSKESRNNEKWAHYLFSHLSKRCKMPNMVVEKDDNSSHRVIIKVSLDTSLGQGYKLDLMNNEIQLSAGNEQVMLWLCYQLISKIAEQDYRFQASDIPPAAIEIENMQGEFPFEFRGIASPTNANEDMLGVTASHSVDYNWALWGHNLWKIVTDDPSNEIYAEINGKRERSQYCFSSDKLYKQIENYIVDQWGEGSKQDPARFTIMPMDNDLVCTCKLCKAAGNTQTNATPAVTSLVRRLAKRFSNHLFFTSAYATTRQRTKNALPANVGVIISAMDIPMSYTFKDSNAFADFNATLNAWKKITPRIYIWDYARNFDDYLTPYPCLSILQQRIKYYMEQGVKGIFINGSEQSYSTLDDVQTAALQALLVNPKLDLDKYLSVCIKRYYPMSASILLPYYLKLEQRTRQAGIELPYYGGIADELKYIDPEEFETLRAALDKAAKGVGQDERAKLNKILTALSFTSLEKMRLLDHSISLDKATELLEILSGYEGFKDMASYKEALGSLETYIEQWNDDAQNVPANDLLKGLSITATPSINGDNNATSLLSDGKMGFYSDYHTSWLVSKQNWSLTIPATNAKTLRLSLMNAPAWHIWLPKDIKVTQNGQTIASWTTPAISTDKSLTERSIVELDISKASNTAPLKVEMQPVSMKKASIACDEIMAF